MHVCILQVLWSSRPESARSPAWRGNWAPRILGSWKDCPETTDSVGINLSTSKVYFAAHSKYAIPVVNVTELSINSAAP